MPSQDDKEDLKRHAAREVIDILQEISALLVGSEIPYIPLHFLLCPSWIRNSRML
jgi:hypothetical protein